MVVATLYLLKYNNYYNRVVKREENLSAYQSYTLGNPIQGVNFIPNDYVNTTQIVNWSMVNNTPDYVLVVDENQEIQSRWFVINTVRTRAGQLQLSLKRDVIVDFYSAVIDSPCFIERGIPNDTNDPAVYTKGSNTYNQIKKSETLLKDETGCAWVVGYVPRGYHFDKPIEANVVADGSENITVNGIENYQFYQYSQGNNEFVCAPNKKTYSINIGASRFYDNNKSYLITHTFDSNLNTVSTIISEVSSAIYNSVALKIDVNYSTNSPYNIDFDALNKGYATQIRTMDSQFSNYIPENPHTNIITNEFIQQDGQILLDSATNIYYDLHTISTGSIQLEGTAASGALFNAFNTGLNRQIPMKDTITQLYVTISGTADSGSYFIRGSAETYKLSIQQGGASVKTTLNDDRYHLPEQQFDMFCIPYSDELKIYKDGSITINKTNKNIALNMGMQIISTTGEGTVYDVQLLPYCPVRYCIKSDGSFDIGSSKFSYIYDNSNNAVSVVLWAVTSSFTVPQIKVKISGGTTVWGKKYISETKIYRICSPNYNGIFEFNPALNDGVDYVKVDCTYQPFSPYIRVAINFKGLYGSEFNDGRGLICGGDFSLPQATNAWANYQLNNKNYQALFDRQIQNMEISNKITRERELWGIASGTISGASTGALAGGSMIGPIGAFAGLATGGVSLAGGIRDLQLSDQLRKEGIDFSTDSFNMNLENIQALPQGLSKTNPFTKNNKLFPFIEEYGCSQRETVAFDLQYTYRGMNIGRMESIRAFISSPTNSDEGTPNPFGNYLKARMVIIHPEKFHEDYHVATAISEELYKGVFI